MHDLLIAWPGGEARFAPSDSPVAVGRSADASIILTDPAISRRHLEFVWLGSSWIANDSSTHGSFDPIGVRLAPTWTVGANVTVRLGGVGGTEIRLALIDHTIPTPEPPPIESIDAEPPTADENRSAAESDAGPVSADPDPHVQATPPAPPQPPTPPDPAERPAGTTGSTPPSPPMPGGPILEPAPAMAQSNGTESIALAEHDAKPEHPPPPADTQSLLGRSSPGLEPSPSRPEEQSRPSPVGFGFEAPEVEASPPEPAPPPPSIFADPSTPPPAPPDIEPPSVEGSDEPAVDDNGRSPAPSFFDDVAAAPPMPPAEPPPGPTEEPAPSLPPPAEQIYHEHARRTGADELEPPMPVEAAGEKAVAPSDPPPGANQVSPEELLAEFESDDDGFDPDDTFSFRPKSILESTDGPTNEPSPPSGARSDPPPQSRPEAPPGGEPANGDGQQDRDPGPAVGDVSASILDGAPVPNASATEHQLPPMPPAGFDAAVDAGADHDDPSSEHHRSWDEFVAEQKRSGRPAAADTIITDDTIQLAIDGQNYVFVPGVEITVGRDPGCLVNLDERHSLVSRHHLKIEHRDGNWWIEDHSSKGTFIDGRKISSNYKAEGVFLAHLGDDDAGTPMRVITAGDHRPPRSFNLVLVIAFTALVLAAITALGYLLLGSRGTGEEVTVAAGTGTTSASAPPGADLALAKQATVILLADTGFGSGFFVTDTLIVTNQHVAVLDDQLAVGVSRTADEPAQAEFLAETVAVHPFLDIAVLKLTVDALGNPVTTSGLRPVPVGDSGSLTLGDEVYNTGFPQDLSPAGLDDMGDILLPAVSATSGQAANFSIWPGCSNPTRDEFIPVGSPAGVGCAPDGDITRAVVITTFSSGEGASGSPVFADNAVVAVVFSGPEGNENAGRNIATAAFADWLDNVIANNG